MRAADGLALALLSAFALNWGWVVQHSAAHALPALSIRRPLHSLRALFGDLPWLAGFVVGLAGWGLYVAALALAPLSLVQAVSAGGVGVLAALARRRGAAVTRAHWAAVAVSVGGLALLGVSLAGGTTTGARPDAPALALWLIVSALAAAATRGSSAATLGVAAGVLYAAGDVATKAATFGGAWLALVAVLLLTHGSAFVALQLGFQRGGALATAGIATLLTNALPIVAGVALFHEGLPSGALGVARVAAFAAVVAGAALLARREPDAQPSTSSRNSTARVKKSMRFGSF